MQASPSRKAQQSIGLAAEVPSATGNAVSFGDEFYESDTGISRKVVSDATGARVMRTMVMGAAGTFPVALAQAGTGTLTGGNLDVNAGVAITANSRIVAAYRTTVQTAPLQVPNANRVVGTPGNGAFRVTNGVVGDNASTVDWAIFN